MKTKILAVLLGSMALTAFADSSTMATGQMQMQTTMVSSGMSGANKMNINLVENAGQSAKVIINLGSPATLTVYDQNGKLAFTSNLPAGKTTVDTQNFPLGNDLLVVTANQNGSTLTMKQAVMVTAPQQAGS